MKFICPLVVVADMDAAKRFYEEVLGQKVQYDFGENVTFAGGFAIHLRSHFAALLNVPADAIIPKANNGELYFEEDDLDSFLDKLKGISSLEFAHGLREQPWGQRVIRFYDPDHNLVEVGEPMESVVRRFLRQGLSAEAVARRTSMPVDFVRQCQ